MSAIDQIKNIVLKDVEKSGFMDLLRAKLKEEVLNVIDKQSSELKDKARFSWQHPVLKRIQSSKEGMICLELIQEFLDFFKMDFSLSVFKKEVHLTKEPNRNKIVEDLNMPNNPDSRQPLLVSILKDYQQSIDPSFNSRRNRDLRESRDQRYENQENSRSDFSRPNAFEKQKSNTSSQESNDRRREQEEQERKQREKEREIEEERIRREQYEREIEEIRKEQERLDKIEKERKEREEALEKERLLKEKQEKERKEKIEREFQERQEKDRQILEEKKKKEEEERKKKEAEERKRPKTAPVKKPPTAVNTIRGGANQDQQTAASIYGNLLTIGQKPEDENGPYGMDYADMNQYGYNTHHGGFGGGFGGQPANKFSAYVDPYAAIDMNADLKKTTKPKNNKKKSGDESSDYLDEEIDEFGMSSGSYQHSREKDKKNQNPNNPFFTSSEDFLGASQSMGVDLSVNSEALEDYDYVVAVDKRNK